LALTASAFEHEREEILACGADDFVTKPFREQTIFAKLAEHLGVEYEYEEAASAGPRSPGEPPPARTSTNPVSRGVAAPGSRRRR
jgi:DNA-binding response OmpR family regulator